MKKIYIPKEEELAATLSYKNVNGYRYIIAKVVEKCLANNIYVNSLDKSLKDIEELTNAICYIYPQEIRPGSVNSNNLALCMRLLDKKSNDNIYRLDNLSRFNNNILNNDKLIFQVIEILYKELRYNPEYRFAYKENDLLERLFNCQLSLEMPISTIEQIIAIEPMYVYKLPNKTTVSDNVRLSIAIDEYTKRFGIPYSVGKEYLGKNILKESDEKVKKLIKYLYK